MRDILARPDDDARCSGRGPHFGDPKGDAGLIVLEILQHVLSDRLVIRLGDRTPLLSEQKFLVAPVASGNVHRSLYLEPVMDASRLFWH
jgi:hypothetical protein